MNWVDSWRAAKRDLYGMNRRNIALIYPHNQRCHYPIADDKLLAKLWLERAGVPTVETLATCAGLFQVPETVTRLLLREDFVVKPAQGAGGDGILVVAERTARGRWRTAGGEVLTADDLRRHLAHIVFGAFCKKGDDHAFIERRVTPPPFFTELSPGGLADLRIITLIARPIMAMLRVPTSLSGGRANLSQGGLGVAIELSSGRMTRAVLSGTPVTAHPDTGVPLIGRVVPGWSALIHLARRAARAVPLEYLGVDLVVDETFGPRVLEINARPGIEIQNVHGTGIGQFLAEAGW